jgi:hypothetical protein
MAACGSAGSCLRPARDRRLRHFFVQQFIRWHAFRGRILVVVKLVLAVLFFFVFVLQLKRFW